MKFFYLLGKYYLVDAGYANAPGFLAPYRGVRYHLSEHRGRNPENEKELFNKLHSQARNVIERAFGILKGRFSILKTTPQYSIPVQIAIVTACCVLHNFIRENGDQDYEDDTQNDASHINEGQYNIDVIGDQELSQFLETSQASQHMRFSQRERDDWRKFRDLRARTMWNEYIQRRGAP